MFLAVFLLPNGGIKQTEKARTRPQDGSNPRKISMSWGGSGEPYRIRTYDPLIKSQLLYQLS